MVLSLLIRFASINYIFLVAHRYLCFVDYSEYEGTALHRFLCKLTLLMRDRLSLLVYDSVQAWVGFLKRYDVPQVANEDNEHTDSDAGASVYCIEKCVSDSGFKARCHLPLLTSFVF